MTEPLPSASPCRSHRRTVFLIVLLIVVAAAGVTFKYARHHLLAKRFAVVEPGRLYRAGYCEPGPLTRIIRQNKIRTILTLLNDEPNSPDQQKEDRVARDEGVTLLRIGMPGDGCAEFHLLEQAAGIIADPSRQPLLVHCYAGTNRTGAVYAVWRMKHCGWNYQETMDECQDYELSPYHNAKLFEHLKRYYTERIEPARARERVQTSPSTRPAATSG